MKAIKNFFRKLFKDSEGLKRNIGKFLIVVASALQTYGKPELAEIATYLASFFVVTGVAHAKIQNK